MGLLYNRIQINPELLEKNNSEITMADYKQGRAVGTLPKGKLKGIYYLSYIQALGAWEKIDYQEPVPSSSASPEQKSFIVGHTDITIKDTRGRLVTDVADLRSYERRYMVEKDAKCISFDLDHNESIRIDWDAQGHDFPPCGEFVFIIEETECVCEITSPSSPVPTNGASLFNKFTP